ncbi:MAG: serine/threonine protein kinase [Trichocoleus desertorum ATA4-8-CV12]|jgi:serine/threonine protein kinase|nr:serine/threonine protein kinase [Trichocoleus desertorum ATA4-8-CV12]
MLQADQVLQERYQLKQKLGQNAGRQTWLAEDLQVAPPEPVIIKLLTFGGDVQWDDLKLFEREAQVLKQLDHPRIPKCRDSFAIDDRTLWFGLVQDYIPGDSLKDLLNKGKKFTETEVRKIAVSVLKILIYLHALNPPVLHRDIKPSNLIWGDDQNVYLVDFGAVQDRATAEGATFTVVGTYGYAPMEQFGGRTVPASDLYALGATLVHLLTGVAPADLPQSDLTIEFRDRTSASDRLLTWIGKFIEPSLKQRFSQAQQALDALKSGSLSNTTSRKLSPPTSTGVKVQRTKKQLMIVLPPIKQPFWATPGAQVQSWSRAVVALLMGSMTLPFFIFFFAPSLPGFAIFSGIFLPVLFSYFLNVSDQEKILITQGIFSIQVWRSNRWIASKRQDSSKEIQDVFQSLQILPDSNKAKEMVTIQTQTERFSFGLGLSGVECVWIAQEIKSWLGLERR